MTRTGRPVRYAHKTHERTFMLDDASDALINDTALVLRCSRSDALVHLLRAVKAGGRPRANGGTSKRRGVNP